MATGKKSLTTEEASPHGLTTTTTSETQEGAARLLTVANPVATGTARATPLAGNDAGNAFAAQTNPAHGRTLQVTFAAGWDGGDVTMDVTDQFGNVTPTTFASAPGTTVQSPGCVVSYANAQKTLVGAAADTATIEDGPILAVPTELENTDALLFCDGVAEAVTMENAESGFTPTTPPDGVHDYVIIYNGAHRHSHTPHTHVLTV